MKPSRKKLLITIEEQLIHSLSHYREYEIDLTIEDSDFSKEILLIKVLNNFDRYKRAFQQFQINIDNFAILERQIHNILNEIEQNQKFYKLAREYFSKKRLKSMLSQLEEKTLDKKDESSDNEKNKFLSYSIKLMDNVTMALNSNFSVYRDIKTIFEPSLAEYNKIINANHYLLQYYCNEINTLAGQLLVPRNNLNNWWYQFQGLTETNLDTLFSRFYEKKNQNAYIAELIVEMVKKSSKTFVDMKNIFEKAIDWGRGNLDEFDYVISSFMKSDKTTPAYATWSESKNDLVKSDHAIPARLLKEVVSEKIINELIILAKESTLDLDQNKKNEIIATAYLLIGETQKAMDILERD